MNNITISKARFFLIFALNMLIGAIATIIFNYFGKGFTDWLSDHILILGIITSILVIIPVVLLFKSNI